MWAALLRRQTSVLLVFLALVLSQACLSHWSSPSAGEAVPVTVVAASHEPHDSPQPSRRPHFSHWSAVRVSPADSDSPDPLGAATGLAAPRGDVDRPAVRDGAAPALLAARTPAALQVFRS
jgi:hypothetical protein